MPQIYTHWSVNQCAGMRDPHSDQAGRADSGPCWAGIIMNIMQGKTQQEQGFMTRWELKSPCHNFCGPGLRKHIKPGCFCDSDPCWQTCSSKIWFTKSAEARGLRNCHHMTSRSVVFFFNDIYTFTVASIPYTAEQAQGDQIQLIDYCEIPLAPGACSCPISYSDTCDTRRSKSDTDEEADIQDALHFHGNYRTVFLRLFWWIK